MINNQENRDFCTSQLDRLSGTSFFDDLSEVALKELGDSLLSAADCQEQAREIITGWFRAGNKRFPTPGDIYSAARAMEKPTEVPAPIPACDRCRDTPGFVHMELIQKFGMWAGEKRDVSDFCTCDLGKAKRAGAAELKKQPSTRPDFIDCTPTKRMKEILDDAS